MHSRVRGEWAASAAVVSVVASALLAGCSGGSSPTGATAGAVGTTSPAATPAGSGKEHDHSTHSHDHAGAASLPPAGDGTRAREIGYSLRQVRLPAAPERAGRLSFVIENYRGRPQTRFLTEQTKRMHVYVVRDDFAVFRHVHPEMQRGGRWVGNLTLPEPGTYRVVAEFLARDEGGDGDHVMLGRRVTVPGRWQPQAPPASSGTARDWGVEATVLTDLVAVLDQELRIRLTAPDGGGLPLGEYLGTSAHLTGFHVESGAAAHMHPTASPVTSEQGTELVFHGSFPTLGEYVLFLQVSVDGFLHTLPIPVTAR
jgi:hypothetical protein